VIRFLVVHQHGWTEQEKNRRSEVRS